MIKLRLQRETFGWPMPFSFLRIAMSSRGPTPWPVGGLKLSSATDVDRAPVRSFYTRE